MTKRRLLLADDSITIQKVVNLTFADEGIEVIAVGDGDAAMEKFVQATPDLVMVDVNMPGFDGYKICEIIKQDEETRHIPVILLVGSFEPFDEEEARRVGADDYLTKPFQSIRQLVGKVTALLDSTQSPSSSNDEAEVENTETSLSENAYQGWTQDDLVAEDEIQIKQVVNLATDESQNFPSESPVENSGEIDSISASESTRENVYEFTGGEDFLRENAKDDVEDFTPIFSEQEAQLKENITGESDNLQSEKDEETASGNKDGSLLELDDINLLDLSPIADDAAGAIDFRDETIDVVKPFETEEEKEAETASPVEDLQSESEPETEFQSNGNKESVEPEITTQTVQSFDSANLSPEMIDAIADRVVEKISDKVIREIAWEVVPQMADLIVRKMAEDKLKN